MIFFVAACNTQKESDTPVTITKPSEAFHVRTAPVVMSDLSNLIQVTGVIESDTEAKPSFKTGGVISRVYVKEGDHVKKGQIIARLDMTEIEAQATQAKFALDKATRDQQRIQNLYADSIVTTEQLQNSGTAVDMAKKSLQIAEFNVAYSEVRSPIEGKVIAQLLHVGEITGPGIPVVYIIGVRQTDWKIVAGLTDKDWGRVRGGDKATIRLDAYPEWQIEGKVKRLSDVANPMSGTFNVELDLPSRDKRIAAGLLAHVEITPSASQAYQVIPIEALVSSNGRTGVVYVPKDSIAEKRIIQIQRFQGEMIAVQSGLEGVTEVITAGSSFLEDGDQIIID